ncbi:MAG: tripartite tricarboxylate transporter substrate-binding protein [Treponema sp.]|nr:tripartite tricarboxylate transporter substrate-binding protein [Treponema sp.]
MKKIFMFVAIAFICSVTNAGGTKGILNSWVEDWPTQPITVICPWAVGGVVDTVNRTLAAYGEKIFKQPIVATNDFVRNEAISVSENFLKTVTPLLGDGGNVALTNYLDTKANEPVFIIGSENAFAITPNVHTERPVSFDYNDFEPVISLCSAVFVMTANARLNIVDLESLKAYGQGKTLMVAVGGTNSIEYFMLKQLSEELGLKLQVVAYNGANLALNALMKGEVDLAVSHQSQAKQGVETGIITPVVLFDEKGSDEGVYAGVKGVGEYGYTAYCKNRSFLMARKGTNAAIIQKVYDGYKEILAQEEIKQLYKSMMIEIEPLDAIEINKHLTEVQAMVKAHL